MGRQKTKNVLALRGVFDLRGFRTAGRTSRYIKGKARWGSVCVLLILVLSQDFGCFGKISTD